MNFNIKERFLYLNLSQENNDETICYEGITIKKENICFKVYKDESCFLIIETSIENDVVSVRLKSSYKAAYGLGERFDSINQKGLKRSLEVIEKFCYQGAVTYCPIPFFFTDAGYGVYIDTLKVSGVAFEDDIVITLDGALNELPELVLFFGKPAEIIEDYSSLTGVVKLPPKWSFGIWGSANRWNTQTEMEKQIELMKKHRLPHTAMVIEAWSDEATFYIWNGAEYKENDGSKGNSYSEFEFEKSPYWTDPKAMIDKLHEQGTKLILWQIPAIKKLEMGRYCEQHEQDETYAAENRLVALNPDGSPYTIPDGHWFSGSMIPDFTNPEAVEWWFNKRKYLLEIGVDGFKTDGGEFIYSDDITFFDGSTGREMKNGYAKRYIDAYTDFIGENRVLFSRAGYTGQQRCPVQWAGDQQSTWEEFRSILKAGLSAGLSGIPFWSFDIAGFAGPMPSMELYERSTQMAVFTPVMQWHSEPVGGQFAELMPSAKGINDRSPWNMAEVYNDSDALERLRFHYNLRGNLIPTIYNEALKSQKTGQPMMRHLALCYPDDVNVHGIEDEFVLGDLLVAPIMVEGQIKRNVYLPEGSWIDLWNKNQHSGRQWIKSEAYENRIPVYIREGGAVALNLDDSKKLGSYIGSGVEEYSNLCFYITGEDGKTSFFDDRGNDFDIVWSGGNVNIDRRSGKVEVEILRDM